MTPDHWQQVERLYRQARAAHTTEERAKVLASADPDLRREVEALLANEPADSTETLATPLGIGAGFTIGHYRIESKLGEGGMGSVYKAVDTKLNRPVAIKFLSSDLADAEARRRFQREAQMASSLNHPHIVTVYDAGEIDGRQYLVTEYVDGGTLRDWASKDKRSWKQIVDLLTGIADGLAAAHQAGIVHRDIKPSNILVAKNGYAKLADFGLAKLAEGTQIDVARTLSQGGTRPGVIVGTIAYMSPEQASGQELDARSDIFSLGVVLYELLAGRRPFSGATDLEVLQTIIHGSPERLPESIPPPLCNVVEKALEKEPSERFQSAREMVVDLRRLVRNKPQASSPTAATPARKTHAKWALPLAVAAALAVGFGLWNRLGRLTELPNPLDGARFTRLTDFEGMEANPAISPDGKFFAFISDRDGVADIWLGQTANGNLRNLTGGKINNIRGPLRNIGFNGDGSDIWVAGIQSRRLQLLPLVGGNPRNFLGETAAEVAWSPDGTRLVYHLRDPGDAMLIADGSGANPRTLLAAGPPDEHRHFQAWSLDSKWIYFARGRPATREMDLWRVPSGGGDPEQITHVKTDVASPTPINARTLLYVARDADGAGPWLWALDLENRRSSRITQGLEHYTAVAASANGSRLVATVVNSQVNLWTVPILDRPANELDVKLFQLPTARASASRFGKETLFYLSSRDGAEGLWIFQKGQAAEIWKGSNGPLLSPPAVSPDGRSVAIAIRQDARVPWNLLGSDGTGLRPLTGEVDARGTASWSPDGNWIVTGGSDSSGPGLFKIPVNGGPPARLRSGPALDPVWSPDGNLIVYGGANVFTNVPLVGVRPDGTPVNLPQIVVRRDGERARFMPDGKGLVYMQNETLAQDFWLLDLATMRSRKLTAFNNTDAMRTFDVTPDGKQIVFDRLRENSDIVLIDLPERQ
jgi:Tol biopolymer transport system component/predicted Ser/Thr protein kinase